MPAARFTADRFEQPIAERTLGRGAIHSGSRLKQTGVPRTFEEPLFGRLGERQAQGGPQGLMLRSCVVVRGHGGSRFATLSGLDFGPSPIVPRGRREPQPECLPSLL